MPEFTYEALEKTGKTTTGTITARDTTEAAAKVRQLGVFPTAIHNGSKPISNGTARNGTTAKNGKANVEVVKEADTEKNGSDGKRVSRLHILLFTREMSDLLDAGLPMDRAFSVLIDQADQPQLRAMLNAMQGNIRAGQPLSEALAKFPREFPTLYSNMVRAGEVSGQLAGVMTRLADFLEKEQIRRTQIMGALAYPMVLISVAILAVIFLLTFAIPKLTPMFKNMGATLPTPTTILLGISGFVVQYWWAIIMALLVGFFGFRFWVNTHSGRLAFDGFRLKLPLFGPLLQKVVSARLVRTLGTLLSGGVPILEAMDIAASAVGNVVATEAILVVRGGVRQGEMLHEAMEKAGGFLPVVTHMTAVGEETGRLPNMLLRTADTLDFEVDSAMKRMTSLIEPLVVLLMGVFIGFVVLSILLPIFQISSMVK